MKHSGRRRGYKSWFVEPYRQVKLGILFLLLNMAFAGLMFGIFGYYVWDIYQSLAVYFKLTNDQSLEILEKFQTPVLVGGALIFVFIAASILLPGYRTSRIHCWSSCGPQDLSRFQRCSRYFHSKTLYGLSLPLGHWGPYRLHLVKHLVPVCRSPVLNDSSLDRLDR